MPGDVAQMAAVAHDERAGGDRLEPGLVVVDGHRVGVLDPVEEVAAGRRDQQPAAVRRVDVQPRVVAAAQAGDLGKRVDRAEVGGARGGHDGHRDQVGVADVGQSAAQLGHVHPASGVDRHPDDRAVAQPEQPGGLLHAEVPVGRGEDPQLGRVAVDRERAVAGEQQPLQVGLGAAAGEDAVGGRAEPDPLRRPVDQVPLHERAPAALVEGVQAGVDGADEHLGEQRRHHDRAVEVGGVRRLVEPHRVVEVDPAHLDQRLLGVVQRPVEVDVRDQLGRLLGLHAGRGPGHPAHRLREMIDAQPHRGDVLVDVLWVEEVVQGGLV